MTELKTLEDFEVDHICTYPEMKKGERIGRWFKEVEITLNDFANWLNNWGDLERYRKFYSRDYRIGYAQAIGDIFNKLGLKFKRYDKRTKNGYQKEEIKILKDIFEMDSSYNGKFKVHLKAEAIKHYKEISSQVNAKDFIKLFFNLTEEDLK